MSMKTNIGLSVIVPTYKRADDLPRLFSSLLQQDYAPEEIFVVIGPQDYRSIEVAKEWRSKLPSIKIIEGSKPSVVNALNTALILVKEAVVCLIDDDVWLPPDWSSKIRSAYESDHRLGAYGGRDHLQLKDEPALSNPLPAETVGMFTWNGSLIGNHHKGSTNSPVEIDVLKGANLSFRRSAFISMQIDSVLEGHGAETCWEIDICLKVKRAGYKVIYDNDNMVLHYASPRLTTDNRTDLFSPAWRGRLFNESFIIAKFRSTHELIFFVLKTFVIGYRLQPGIVWSLLLFHKYGLNVLLLPFSNTRNMARGIKLGLKQRKEPDHPENSNPDKRKPDTVSELNHVS